jgi:TrmH family RNA methyltransferase
MGRRSTRRAEGCFVIEGVNLLAEALRAGTEIESLYLDAGALTRPGPGAERLTSLVDSALERGTRAFELEPGVLERVAETVTPQPVLAVVPLRETSLGDVIGAEPSLVVVCVDVRDPGNAGTVLRSAGAAGAQAVICCGSTVDPWSPKTVRASAGAVLRLPVVEAGEVAETLARLGQAGLCRVGTVVEGGRDYAAVDLARRCAVVLGNEAHGLDLAAMGAELDELVTIPMAAGAESLNVGMAAAVVCFEVARQRRHGRPGSDHAA